MTKRGYYPILFSVILVSSSGCSDEGRSNGGSVSKNTVVVNANDYLLAAEPAGSRGVIELRKEAKDGDEVVVAGRVGGSKEPIVKGRAAFTIVDSSFVPCNEREGDECKTPWDYCCDTKEDLAKGSVMVKFVDAQGKTLQQDAEGLLGIRPLRTVVVCGRAKRDLDGNLTVVASKLFVKQ